MEIMEAMAKRHSVRQYTDEPIDKNTLDALKDEIAACNEAVSYTHLRELHKV